MLEAQLHLYNLWRLCQLRLLTLQSHAEEKETVDDEEEKIRICSQSKNYFNPYEWAVSCRLSSVSVCVCVCIATAIAALPAHHTLLTATMYQPFDTHTTSKLWFWKMKRRRKHHRRNVTKNVSRLFMPFNFSTTLLSSFTLCAVFVSIDAENEFRTCVIFFFRFPFITCDRNQIIYWSTQKRQRRPAVTMTATKKKCVQMCLDPSVCLFQYCIMCRCIIALGHRFNVAMFVRSDIVISNGPSVPFSLSRCHQHPLKPNYCFISTRKSWYSRAPTADGDGDWTYSFIFIRMFDICGIYRAVSTNRRERPSHMGNFT